jgi:hypothetical protein
MSVPIVDTVTALQPHRGTARVHLLLGPAGACGRAKTFKRRIERQPITAVTCDHCLPAVRLILQRQTRLGTPRPFSCQQLADMRIAHAHRSATCITCLWLATLDDALAQLGAALLNTTVEAPDV